MKRKLVRVALAVCTVGLAQRRDTRILSVGVGLLAFSVFFWASEAVFWSRTR